MKHFFTLLLKISFSILLTLALLELGLRLFPGIIPLDMLNRFEDPARTKIAQSRQLLTNEDTVVLMRDDNGPPLRIIKPFTTIARYNEDTNETVTQSRDEMGFCNPQGSYQQPQIDIISLGDSFTACHTLHIKDTWTSQLAQLSGKNTYNLGRIGIGIHEYLQIFKQFGVQKLPKVVILNIYEGNDLRDAERYYQYAKRIESTETESPPLSAALSTSAENSPGFSVTRYSYAINLLQTLPRQIEKEVQLLTGTTSNSSNFRYNLVFSNGNKVLFNPRNIDLDEVRFAKSLQEKRVSLPVAQAIENALQTFVGLAKLHNFVPVVSYTPSAYTTYTDYVQFEDPALQNVMPQFSQEQRAFLEAASSTYGYTFIDLTPALQAAAREREGQELLYYRYDLHLTPAGHKVVANALNQALPEIMSLRGNTQ